MEIEPKDTDSVIPADFEPQTNLYKARDFFQKSSHKIISLGCFMVIYSVTTKQRISEDVQ